MRRSSAHCWARRLVGGWLAVWVGMTGCASDPRRAEPDWPDRMREEDRNSWERDRLDQEMRLHADRDKVSRGGRRGD